VADAVRQVTLPQCKLVVVKGATRGREYVVSSDVIRVGKANDNDLVLAEETVSRVHLEILRDAKGYLLRDLHSTNGTFLDGAEIREAYIRAGAIITVGTVQLRFQPFEERIDIVPGEATELGELVGRSPAMREIFALLDRLAPTDATLLVEGEPGTGKDLVARTAHAHSRRRSGPLITVDCGALAGNLLESALFGHEKGAFPGASTARQGSFELAHGGTIFLAHVGELSVDIQPKLLRVLEQREIRRVGGSRAIKVDLRFIAATQHDLRREVEKGKFREDLYFRLAVVPMRLPPLRERKEDIPSLVRHFQSKGSAANGEEGKRIEPADDLLAALASHDWPGNVRELRALVERGLFLGGVPGVAPAAAAPRGKGEVARTSDEELVFDAQRSYRDNKVSWERVFEQRYLRWLLARAAGNISRAAREADMDRKYLHKLLKKHRIVT
jgi:DNA-binding NtrC family response regulator